MSLYNDNDYSNNDDNNFDYYYDNKFKQLYNKFMEDLSFKSMTEIFALVESFKSLYPNYSKKQLRLIFISPDGKLIEGELLNKYINENKEIIYTSCDFSKEDSENSDNIVMKIKIDIRDKSIELEESNENDDRDDL